ncbi:MAG: Na+/H+ antiporter NhaC family protein [Firmicutes bacterium]|jgi:Na+/H+ antiporter NhaC|nr:Na+/H+ antiporter NhaC family protein [Bacillota bacterium]
MKKRGIILVLVALLVVLFSGTVFADTASPEMNASKFGVLTLLPPFIAILLAFLTKNVILSLFIGVFSGTFLVGLNSYNIFGAIMHGFLNIVNLVLGSLADSWNAGIILQCLTIGGLIALITKMGGARAVAEALAKRAKTQRSAQLVTWVLGLFVFFDDYANALIVGPIMRPVTDKLRISREKLAFIIDATAAPIAGIALISTWVGYEIGLIKDGYASIGMDVNAYNVFIETIPYRFYNILILVFIVASAMMLREFGPMYKAEKRARTTGKLLPDGAHPMIAEDTTDIEPNEGVKLSIWSAIIPIMTLIVSAFVGFYFNGYSALDPEMMAMVDKAPLSIISIRETFGASDASIVLFQAALIASVVALIMGASQKMFKIGEGIDVFVQGTKSLLITAIILLLAWSLSGVIKELGTAKFLVELLSDKVPAFILPSIIFVLGSIISFATGTSYGTMGILMPLTIPLAFAINPVESYVVMCAGAVLTGAIFGDHCSPISDTTILSSMGSACDHIEHTRTQLVYALSVAAISILFGYIPVGLGMNVALVLPIGMVAVVVFLRLFGKSVKEEALRA